MLQNYFKTAFRNLAKNKGYSAINVAGLAVGMTVAMLVGLWIHDELSFNKYHQHYDRVAQLMVHKTFNGERYSMIWNPYHMGTVTREAYGSDFKYVQMSTVSQGHILAYGDKKLTKTGNFMEARSPEMLSLRMVRGTRTGLQEPGSILLSESVARAFFGDADPLDKIMEINNKMTVKVTGVYEDLPYNSDFKDLLFVAPWELYLSGEPHIEQVPNPWDNNSFQTFVQLAEHADVEKVSAKMKNLIASKMPREDALLLKPEVFLHPMAKWHLYSEFRNGVNTGGRIQFVWLFGMIGGFVLLLACINFMNLSTARSEKRAKEVGVRKAIGSSRSQLVSQFFSESLLVAAFALVVSLVLVLLILPAFNAVADKRMAILWTTPLFYLATLAFMLFTGLVAGLYPALYLSSFQPVKVLKGTFKLGRLAALPRKVLVVVQFTVSVVLIIGTIVVFRQVQFAKDRPIGYNRDGLLIMSMTPDIQRQFNVIRDELKRSGAVVEAAMAANPTTEYYVIVDGFTWKGKDPSVSMGFPFNNVTPEYGKTIGWTIKEGRDFSREFTTDSSAFILNEAAVKIMGLKNPVGETVLRDSRTFTVIGVIKDIINESPYRPVVPSIFHMSNMQSNVVTMKINRSLSPDKALGEIGKVFKRYNPATPFEYRFVDQEYAKKFGDEERVGKLTSFFAVLAILISCLGLFGLASFVAEQRTKEIGVRKVLGASVGSVWGLLSKDFLTLVLLSCLLASPIAWYFLSGWLQQYEYRTEIAWWIFLVSAVGAVVLTLLTVSYQAIKAALLNPVKSLRSE